MAATLPTTAASQGANSPSSSLSSSLLSSPVYFVLFSLGFIEAENQGSIFGGDSDLEQAHNLV